MRLWTHEELHAGMDSNPILKAKSDKAHSVPQNTPAEKEQGKLEMMEIYVEVTSCKQVESAKEFIRKFFVQVKPKEGLEALRVEFAAKKLCHSPAGNDYMCFCD